MNPSQLKNYLITLKEKNIRRSVMLWGPPGVGKSSIVAQIAKEYKLGFIDLRLSQLAPTDLRGLPVATDDGLSTWYPPEFLPRDGQGILFLDEINMAPPALQGIAQQLILDRQVGAYKVPEGWFIWAAGNRKEDKASVSEMPAPLANRFLHLQVEPDFNSFKNYALTQGLHEQIIAFLSFRPELLYRLEHQQLAWPSPRSWEMASELHQAEIDIRPALGEGVSTEFYAYIQIYNKLPDLGSILDGNGKNISFAKDLSIRYATTIGLTVRASNGTQAYHALAWLNDKATPEWVQLYMTDIIPRIKQKQQMGVLAKSVAKNTALQKAFKEYQELFGVL